MSSYGPDSGSCTVRVFKAGLLAAVGHDLELRLDRWSLSVADDHVEGSFDATSLVVVGALKDGRVDPAALSDKDKRDILDNVRKRVFKKHRADQIRFEADDLEVDDELIEGRGTLHIPPGRHDVDFVVNVDGDRASCRLRLHQPDWGLVPFRAPLGVLKIKPDLELRLDLRWQG